MSGSARSSPQRRPARMPSWLVVIIFLAIVAVSWWQTNEPPAKQQNGEGHTLPAITDQDSQKPVDPADRPFDIQITPEHDSSLASPETSTSTIANQAIRDQGGQIVYEGPVDLKPTLDRIAQGKRLSHRNDGTIFQNRERHLPTRPSGYYREYVHPTPNLNGPGPQRVVVGKDGDIWYTPDHYGSFRRIK